MIPLINLTIDKTLEGKIKKAILRVVSSKHYILGSELEKFEKDFANYLGIKYAIGVGSGTDALRLALRALGIGKGDKVLTVSFSSPFTAIAILEEGAIPVFCDIDSDTLTIDINDIKRKMDGKTKAIMPVHLYGNPSDIQGILKLAKIYKLKVIEDACQSHGAKYENKAIGTFGDAAAFSFYPTKNLGGLGDGGMLVTKKKEVALKAKLLRHGGQTKRFWHKLKGINSRLDEIQAAVLRSKLPYLDRDNQRREKLAENYRKKLSHLPIKFQKGYKGAKSANHLFVIRTNKRVLLKEFLSRQGIGSDIYYPFPIHIQPAFLGLNSKGLKVTEEASGEILAIPISPTLSNTEQELIINNIIRFFQKSEY